MALATGGRGSRPASRCCLALHGLGGGPYEFGSLLEALKQEGMEVSAPVLPGHEGSGGTMPASRWEDWCAAAEHAFDSLSASGSPVAVVGFSTGGTLALRLATRRPVARLVVLAPFLAIRYSRLLPFHPSQYLRPLARILPDLPRRPLPLRDRSMRGHLRSTQRFATFNLLATLSALELIEQVKPLVPTIRTPTLILQGRLDTVVEPSGAEWLERHLGAPEKRLLWFERSDHLLALDRERDEVIRAVLSFLHSF